MAPFIIIIASFPIHILLHTKIFQKEGQQRTVDNQVSLPPQQKQHHNSGCEQNDSDLGWGRDREDVKEKGLYRHSVGFSPVIGHKFEALTDVTVQIMPNCGKDILSLIMSNCRPDIFIINVKSWWVAFIGGVICKRFRLLKIGEDMI